MSNETENRKETVLDLLEDQAQNFAHFVKEGWEYAVKSSTEKGFDLAHCFKTYHRSATMTFAQTVMDPHRMMTLVLGAVARELIAAMSVEQAAELATVTLDQLNYNHERHGDGNEED